MNIQEPTVSVSDTPHGSETKLTHPAYAQIRVSRVSGRTNLFGSDFDHHSYVSITLSEAELHRSLSSDWIYGRKQIVEFALSEAQWATFVSSFNNDGVPCTLTWERGQGVVPRLPAAASRTKQFNAELQEDFVEALSALDDLKAEVEAATSGISKKKQAGLLGHIRTVRAKITSSIPYVVDSFDEHMENGIEKAKVEIHGYTSQIFQRAGIQALSEQHPITLAVEDKSA